MGREISIKDTQGNELEAAMYQASSIIHKAYLGQLEELSLEQPSTTIQKLDVSECGTFYQLTRLVVNQEENFLDKLVTIANVVAGVNGSLTTIIKSDGQNVQYYMGVIAKKNRQTGEKHQHTGIRAGISSAFVGAMEGNFIGSNIVPLEKQAIREMREEIFHPEVQSISSISGIVSLRNQERTGMASYVQGIENLTHALSGKKYTIVMIADPMTTQSIEAIREGYEILHTQLSMFSSSVLTVNQSNSVTLTTTESESIANSITDGITRTQSHGTNTSTNTGKNKGGNLSLLLGGISSGKSWGESKGTNYNDSYGMTRSETLQQSSQRGTSDSTTEGAGQSIQISVENRSIKGLLDKIDLHIKRLELCESFGAFDCATYILAENPGDALAVAGNYHALMRGEDSFVQGSYINKWAFDKYSSDESVQEGIVQYLRAFTHPNFYLDESKQITVTPACQISGQELAIQFGLPKKSIDGLTVLEMTPFGRNPEPAQGEALPLGKLCYMGKEERTSVELSVQDLTKHVFVTGATGSGKSNTVYHMLDELTSRGVAFMVVEPAKGEYKQIFGGRRDVTVYGTNPNLSALLRINPFAFPKDIHVLEHIDRLVEIFNACWPMYAAMPAVLKDAMEQAYTACGWSLVSSTCASGTFPTFRDVLGELPLVMEQSAYSKDTKGDYVGALVTRVKSLTNGINGQVFCGLDTIPDEALFDKNIIVDLSRVGSSETKALIMGLLVMKLQEYRMCSGDMNSKLKHVTVLEEAHNLLRCTSSEQSQESSNLQGKSVEMLANAIAEMRTYGEGFIIADQSPGLLDPSVIRNTNTKILMRLPDQSDRVLVGKSIGLNDDQIIELAKLEVGVAAVYQNNWLEAVLCKVNYFTKESPYQFEPSDVDSSPWKDRFLRHMLADDRKDSLVSAEDVDNLKKWIGSLETGVGAKNNLLDVVVQNRQITDGQRNELLYQMVKGAALCQRAENLYPPDGIPVFLDSAISDRLQVSQELASEIRLHMLSHVAGAMGANHTFVEKLRATGGIR